ncbi:cardiolipin synthase [Roseovarius nanhaiticus]|uniref:cardiolipin synthase n=1 Tax=Roseovarius nanhaiticus TaxID=573024 RepID=UPI00248F9681|nr:cardiolipin synthase [Roseovarius nanhaiticus]
MNIALIAHIAVVVGFTIRLMLRNDLSPPARLAWIIVLILLPVFGTIVYVLFGEVDLGREARAKQRSIHDEVHRAAGGQLMGDPETLTDQISAAFRPVFGYAASINGFHPTTGNQGELMAHAAETRTRMVADIDAATDHVHALYYIWLTDRTGTEMAEALMRAAQRGVTCRVLADGLGSRGLIKSELWRRMDAAGVHLAVALPITRPIRTILTSRLDMRNHRKITVIDGTITYCGSRNTADPEFRPKAKYGPWVDIMLRLTGPVVAQNQLLFASDWMRATGEPPEALARPCPPLPGGFPAQAMGHGPTERRSSTPQLFATALACARERVTISTPYFVPDATVLEALCAAAYRGVTVTLIFPQKNDSWVVAAASHSYYRRLLQAGCIVHEYEPGLLHAKTLVIDGAACLIGSSNIDIRSFDLNFENNILLEDPAIAKAIEARQADYILASRQVTLSDVDAWPYHRRIWNNAVATVGPIL